MSNISALRALSELNKIEASRNEDTEKMQVENKPKFSLFGFGFKDASRTEAIPPEEKSFNIKT